MKYLLYLLLFAFSFATAQEKKQIVIPPSKDSTVIDLTVTSVATASTVTDYRISTRATAVPVTIPPVVIPPVATAGDLIKLSAWRTVAGGRITEVVQDGRSALKIDLKRTDPEQAGGRRAELWGLSGNTYPLEVTYTISYWIPKDWVTDQDGLFDIVNQWHDDTYGTVDGTEYKSPFDFSLDGTRWKAQVRSGAGNVESGFYVGTVEKEKWVDFIFHLKFSKSGAGVQQIWMNNKLVLDQKLAMGYNHTIAPYFKMGLYKWPWNSTDNQKTASSARVFYISGASVSYASGKAK